MTTFLSIVGVACFLVILFTVCVAIARRNYYR